MDKKEILKLLSLFKKSAEKEEKLIAAMGEFGLDVYGDFSATSEIEDAISIMWKELFLEEDCEDGTWLDYWRYDCNFGANKDMKAWIGDKEYKLESDEDFADLLIDWVKYRKEEIEKKKAKTKESNLHNEEVPKTYQITSEVLEKLGNLNNFKTVDKKGDKITMSKIIGNGLVQILLSNDELKAADFRNVNAFTKILFVVSDGYFDINVTGIDTTLQSKRDYKSEEELNKELDKIKKYISCFI